MASPPLRRPLRRKVARAALAVFALLTLTGAGFALAAWLGSALPLNPDWRQPASGVEIMVETNGVHTGIVVPIAAAQHDWREVFPSAALPLPDGQYPTHLAIGWGEREVFLSVPTWGDLKASTALRIATVGGASVMRVSHYVRPAPSESYRPVRLTQAQYAALAAAINDALPAAEAGAPREILRADYSADAFYEARGEYTLATTCNTWVGDVLARAGVKMGRWTPLAGGVTKWIPAPGQVS